MDRRQVKTPSEKAISKMKNYPPLPKLIPLAGILVFVLFELIPSAAPFDTLNTGLAAYWAFDEGSGSAAMDSTIYARHVTLANGPTWVTGKIGKAIRLDGINDYGVFSYIPLTGDFTISAWVCSDWPNGIISIVGNAQNAAMLSFDDWSTFPPGNIRFGYNGGSWVKWNLRPIASEWHQLTLIYTKASSRAELFIDGSSAGARSISGNWSTSTYAPQYIGRSYSATGGLFKGIIDEVRIYSRVLSPDEIQQLYQLAAALAPENQAPTVAAGPDLAVTLPNSVYLDATATDDGLPNPPNRTTSTWTQVSGPGTALFANPQSLKTTASFDIAGSYILRLTVTDGGTTVTDDVLVTVGAADGFRVVRFVAIGDYGDNTVAEANLANMVKSLRPDFIVTLGDNQQDFGGAATIDTMIGKHYSEFIGNYKGTWGTGSAINRFWPALGNHDWYQTAYTNYTAATLPYLNYFTLPEPKLYYLVDKGVVRLYMLDSTLDPDGNTPNSVQATWLKNSLAQSDACYDLVVSHEPPYSTAEKYGSVEHMWWPFNSWGAEAVLSGHNHVYERLHKDGHPFFVNGLGGNGRDLIQNRSVPAGVTSLVRYNSGPGVMLIVVSTNGISYEFYTVDGVRVDSFTQAGCRDTKPPTRSNASPAGILASGTTSTTLSLTTGEPAVCRYALTPGTAYGSMTEGFTTADGFSHSTTLTGLASETLYQYYVRCADQLGNTNTDDFAIRFTIGDSFLTEGLLAYWTFDEGSGTTAADTSGNQRTAALLNGLMWTTGKMGQALSFDGANDYAQFSGIPLTGDFTMSAWIYSANATGFMTVIGNKQNNAILTFDDWSPFPPGNIRLGANGGSWAAWPSRPVTSEWHLLTVVYRKANTQAELFLDGVSKGTRTFSANWSSSYMPQYIGRSYASDFFKGKLDDVRIYGRALTAQEIQLLLVAAASQSSKTASRAGGSSLVSFARRISRSPAINAVNPAAVAAGSRGILLTVTGKNFTSGSVLRWNGQEKTTVVYSSETLVALIPAKDLAASGTVSIEVDNRESGGGTSAAKELWIRGGLVIEAVSPSNITAGSGAFEVTVHLSGFDAGLRSDLPDQEEEQYRVLWNGAVLETRRGGSNILTARVPEVLVSDAGVVEITVENVLSGKRAANSLPVTIGTEVSVPQIDNAKSWEITRAGESVLLTVKGMDFAADSTILWNGSSLPTRFIDSTAITAVIEEADLSLGSEPAIVAVRNPGGGTSRSDKVSQESWNGSGASGMQALNGPVEHTASGALLTQKSEAAMSALGRVRAAFLPVSAHFEESQIYLYNPGPFEAGALIELYGSKGDFLDYACRILEPGALFKTSLTDLFTQERPEEGSYIRVLATEAIGLYQSDGIEGMDSDGAAHVLHAATSLGAAGGPYPNLFLINPGDLSGMVTLRFRNAQGAVVGSEFHFSMNARASLRIPAESYAVAADGTCLEIESKEITLLGMVSDEKGWGE
jgi:hypothetical protein